MDEKLISENAVKSPDLLCMKSIFFWTPKYKKSACRKRNIFILSAWHLTALLLFSLNKLSEITSFLNKKAGKSKANDTPKAELSAVMAFSKRFSTPKCCKGCIYQKVAIHYRYDNVTLFLYSVKTENCQLFRQFFYLLCML